MNRPNRIYITDRLVSRNPGARIGIPKIMGRSAALRTAMMFAALTTAAQTISPALANPAKQAIQIKEPNITGVWELYPDPFSGEENIFAEPPPPEGGPKLKEPYASQWKARRAERDAKLKAGTPLADANTLCIPEGMPSIMAAVYPLQILQNPGQVTVLAEFLAQTRRIFMGKPEPAPDEISPSYYGYSAGHWEGDTLIVTTRGVREDVQFYEIPHSADMIVTERIRITQPGHLENQIVIEDPKILMEPYKFTYGYKRNDEYQVMEYICDRVDPLWKVNQDGTVSMKVGEDNKK